MCTAVFEQRRTVSVDTYQGNGKREIQTMSVCSAEKFKQIPATVEAPLSNNQQCFLYCTVQVQQE